MQLQGQSWSDYDEDKNEEDREFDDNDDDNNDDDDDNNDDDEDKSDGRLVRKIHLAVSPGSADKLHPVINYTTINYCNCYSPQLSCTFSNLNLNCTG